MINFKKIKVVLENEIISTSLKIENDIIKSIGNTEAEDGYDFSDYYLVPGFIDEHIHGSNGFDTMDANIKGIEAMAVSLLKEGVTSFLATTMTASKDDILKAIKTVSEYKSQVGANVLGVHVEGPFINPSAKGAQKEDHIVFPNLKDLDLFNEYQNIKIITCAPEMAGAKDFIKYAVKKEILVSIGHTQATYAIGRDALNLGASQVTHVFNAMTPFNHREVGISGLALLDSRVKCELICDGVHVSKEAINLLLKQKGREGIILITDAIRAKHLNSSVSELGGQKVYINGNEARLENGSLAGSVLKMNEAVKNIMQFTGAKIVDAVYMATVNPAKNLGIYDKKGSININKDADLVVLDKDFDVYMTIVNGKIKYQKEENENGSKSI